MEALLSRSIVRSAPRQLARARGIRTASRRSVFPTSVQSNPQQLSVASRSSPSFTLTCYRNQLSSPLAVAPFHTSAKRAILPAEPQVVEGTANDPAPVPDPSPTHGSYHWAFERIISAGLIPLTIAPFAAGTLNPITDAILCATILIHSHIGFQAVIIDYIPTNRIPKVRTLFWWALRLATLSVGVGLYEFETNDVGLTEGIKRIWTA